MKACTVKLFDFEQNADINAKVYNLDLKITKEGLSRLPVNYSILQ